MDDGLRDPAVESARREFEASYEVWVSLANPDGQLPARPSPHQQSAYDRMREADSAYTAALLLTSLDPDPAERPFRLPVTPAVADVAVGSTVRA